MPRRQEDFEDEINSHLAHEADRLRALGLSPQAAMAGARKRFGNVTSVQESFYYARHRRWWDAVQVDLRYAVRGFRRTPWFSLTLAFVLALGLGITVTIFATLRGVVLSPLPFPQPARLVAVGLASAHQRSINSGLSAGEFRDLRKTTRSFSAVAAYRRWGYELDGAAEPERVLGARVSANLFSMLGVRPLMGRVFAADEDRLESPRVVVLSDSLWRSTFSADPAIVGRTIGLNGAPYVVVGVVALETMYPAAALWVPYVVAQYELDQHGDRSLDVIARLRPSATLEAARADLALLLRNEAQQYPASAIGWQPRMVPLHDVVIGGSRAALGILFMAACGLLFAACANVANGLLARLLTRRRELAIRAAVGASTARLVQQLAAEAFVLVSLAAVGAFGIAVASARWLSHLGPEYLPRSASIRIETTTLALGVALVMLVTVGTSAVMGRLVSRAKLAATMRSRGASAPASGPSARDLFVIAQCGLALILGVDGLVLVKSLRNIQDVNLGFAPDRVVSATVSLPSNRYPTGAARSAMLDDAVARLKSDHDIEAAAFASRVPFQPSPTSGFINTIELPGRSRVADAERTRAAVMVVSPGYFETLRIPVIAGREFTPQDRDDTAPVMVVDEVTAYELAGGKPVIGTIARLGGNTGADTTSRRIVGVVNSVRMSDLTQAPDHLIYLPYVQSPWPTVNVIVRGRQGGRDATATLRETIRSVDPARPVYNVRPLSASLALLLALRRLQALLLSGFACAAVLLAFVGVYSLVAFSVREREREFGIRLAIGATRAQIIVDVVYQTGRRVLIGTGIGVVLATATGFLLRAEVYGISPWNPLVISVVAAIIIAGGMLAAYMPAYRASGADPMIALRNE